MEPAIKIKNLKVKVESTAILKNISVELPAGEIIGLLGPSGAGKTTFIRAIVGRQKIAGGALQVFGLPAGDKRLRSSIGYMTQSPAVYSDLTINENLRYFARMRGLSKNAASEVVDVVKLGPQAKQVVGTLSGGQRSRVSLAVALLGSPKLLVLDEPTVGVDPVLRRELWDLFNGLAGQGSTLLVSSHVMDEAEHCQELVLIRAGKLLATGTPNELRDRTGTKNVEDSFLKLVGAANESE